MSRVVFMCGPAGSGKSTYARRLEHDGFARLSFDQEAWARGHRSMPLPEGIRAEIDAELRRRLATLVSQGRDVVLDFSFWSRAMRADWGREAASLGNAPEIVYVATDRATALARIAARAREHGDDFPLDPATAAAYFDQFEPPTADEGPIAVVRT